MRTSHSGTQGVWIAASALGVFAGIALDVQLGGPLSQLDVRVADGLHALATPGLTQFMDVVSQLHDPWAILAYVGLAGLWLTWRRNWLWLARWGVIVPSGMVLNLILKAIFRRDRPRFDNPLVSLETYSFPSGHACASTLFYGVLAAYLVSRLEPHVAAQRLIWAGAGVLISAVCLSRVTLGAHYLSDVLAGLLVATAWVSFGSYLLQPRNSS